MAPDPEYQKHLERKIFRMQNDINTMQSIVKALDDRVTDLEYKTSEL